MKLHFDLNHLKNDTGLSILFGMHEIPLKVHSDKSLSSAQSENTAMAVMASFSNRFTHFCDLEEHHLTSDTVSCVRLMSPALEGVHLRQTLMMSHFCGREAMLACHDAQRKYYQTHRGYSPHVAKTENHRYPRLFSGKLHDLGLLDLPVNQEHARDTFASAANLITSIDTATSLVAHSPELSSIQPLTAGIIANRHILPDPQIAPEQYNAMQLLSTAIADAGENWSPVVPCKDIHGNPIQAGYDLGTPGEEGAFTAGQQLYTYALDPGVEAAMAMPAAGAGRSASDDTELVNRVWEPVAGTTARVSVNEAEPERRGRSDNRKDKQTSFKWTLNQSTSHHGMSVDLNSIAIDDKQNLSFNASNNYLRTVAFGHQLFNEQGQAIGDLENSYWDIISAVSTLMGIPVPTDPTEINLNLGEASRVKLQFGSLGVSDETNKISNWGTINTCFWQYGLPVIFIIAGKIPAFDKFIQSLLKDRFFVTALAAIVTPFIIDGLTGQKGLPMSRRITATLGQMVLTIALQKGMEKLGTWLVAQVGAGALSNAFGPVAWVLRLAAASLSFELMAVTTAQVLSSPAVFNMTLSRAIDVSLTLHPDPRHGEAGKPETAVWPAVATRYQATLIHSSGHSSVVKGELEWQTTSNQALPIAFVDVPAGGDIQIIVALYSDNGWVAGSWESGNIKALPNRDSTLVLGDHNLTENLVPLAPDTQYVYKESIAYSASAGFQWQVKEPETATVRALDCGNRGTLCAPLGITLNNSAFQVGYTWRASGQNLYPNSSSQPRSDKQLYAVQNLSVLADPQSRFIGSDIGFTVPTAIAYAPAYGRGEELDRNNFALDPRNGKMHLRKVPLGEDAKDFGFDAENLQSWGRFPLGQIDAMAIHPNNVVVAASYSSHKLMLLPIPEQGVSDSDATTALMVSGLGIRQGLLNGPKALSITPDGRILVLESLNKRVQAFDTKGNPVPCFATQGTLFSLPTGDIAADLDAEKVPSAFIRGLTDSEALFRFDLDVSLASHLDAGRFSESDDLVLSALAKENEILAFNPQHIDDPLFSAQLHVENPGQSWTISDPRGFALGLEKHGNEISAFAIPRKTRVEVQTKGQRWTIVDQRSGKAWQLRPSTADANLTLVEPLTSYFQLQNGSAEVTYLDMATEAEGHIYVLFHQRDGSKPTDYYLDVYAPDGQLLSRTPDKSVSQQPQNLVASKIAVDIWRNLYALGFAALQGPAQSVQPTLTHWMPTPPLFSLALSVQKALNDLNITVVTQAFAEHGHRLSRDALITVVDREGSWSIKDGAIIYHLYRTTDSIQVFSVPA